MCGTGRSYCGSCRPAAGILGCPFSLSQKDFLTPVTQASSQALPPRHHQKRPDRSAPTGILPPASCRTLLCPRTGPWDGQVTRIWDCKESLVSEPNSCPGGTSDNSPTFQRWGTSGQIQFSPEGTADLRPPTYPRQLHG